MPHVEFAYNRYVYSTTSYSPFEVVYSSNPLTLLDILPLFDSIKELHAKVHANIEKKNEQYAKQANKGCVRVIFELEDWVWVYTRKERFPTQRKSKL